MQAESADGSAEGLRGAGISAEVPKRGVPKRTLFALDDMNVSAYDWLMANKHAQTLGRRGGKVRGVRKGFAAIAPEKLKQIISDREQKRKKLKMGHIDSQNSS